MENFVAHLKMFDGLRELVIEDNPFLMDSNKITNSAGKDINPRDVISN
jgi:hypothetical protein